MTTKFGLARYTFAGELTAAQHTNTLTNLVGAEPPDEYGQPYLGYVRRAWIHTLHEPDPSTVVTALIAPEPDLSWTDPSRWLGLLIHGIHGDRGESMEFSYEYVDIPEDRVDAWKPPSL